MCEWARGNAPEAPDFDWPSLAFPFLLDGQPWAKPASNLQRGEGHDLFVSNSLCFHVLMGSALLEI